LAVEPPFAGCVGCQHPTVGRIIAEVLDELGIGHRAVLIDGIPCSISSAFGPDVGYKLNLDESAPDVATDLKRNSPDDIVVCVQGQWGLADFSFDVNAFTGALIRGEKFTTILCNMAFWGPKEGRPVPVTEAIEGRLEPATRFDTPEGQKLVKGGYPLHIAELAAMQKGVAYSARGAITSMKDYQLIKSYIRIALQKQMNNAGFSYVEVLCACTDTVYSAPVDCLKWVQEKMTTEFPLGEFKNTG
jgi:2-oxoglutarate ferredoxin oxidoreductase subunit beta